MATRKEIIYDVILRATKLKSPTDSRFNEPDYIGYLVDQKRAKLIRDSYRKDRYIDPIWVQDLSIQTTTKIDYIEDSTVGDAGVDMGKITLPPLVSFSGVEQGIHRVASASKKYKYGYVTPDEFGLILRTAADNPDNFWAKQEVYLRVGESLYVYPYRDKINVQAILESPNDKNMIDNVQVDSGDLKVSTVYKVVSGPITHNSIVYASGDTFTAANTLYTGTGVVIPNSNTRARDDNDEYPLSTSQVDTVINMIFDEEMRQEATKLGDNKVDGVDETIALEGNQ